MSIVLGRGQCGAHITLLFTIDDSSEDPAYQGSRGAGICLKDGVEVIAKGEDGSGEMIVRFKNEGYDSSIYQDVLLELVEEIPEIGDFDWELDIIMSTHVDDLKGGATAKVTDALKKHFQRHFGDCNIVSKCSVHTGIQHVLSQSGSILPQI